MVNLALHPGPGGTTESSVSLSIVTIHIAQGGLSCPETGSELLTLGGVSRGRGYWGGSWRLGLVPVNQVQGLYAEGGRKPQKT